MAPPADADPDASHGNVAVTRLATILFFAVVAAQVVGLLVFAGIRQSIVAEGKEVVLQAFPVDPRSLLQGDYAVLDYEIAQLPDQFGDLRTGSTVYVELRETGGSWSAIGYELTPPSGSVYIRGTVDAPNHLELGIGSYFVPQGTGHIIESAADVKVVVAIATGGRAAIKQVLVEGEPFAP